MEFSSYIRGWDGDNEGFNIWVEVIVLRLIGGNEVVLLLPHLVDTLFGIYKIIGFW
jgi:hypothetical protein